MRPAKRQFEHQANTGEARQGEAGVHSLMPCTPAAAAAAAGLLSPV